MSKKLMLLAAGAFAALAFAALPTIASASEMTFDCETGATCSGKIAGGAAALANDKSPGETVSCTSVTGTTSGTSGSSTQTVQLRFHGCKETISGFNFSCNSAGEPTGTITTNVMTGHGITVTANNTATAGILLTGANVTFVCAAFLTKTVTGNIIGTFTNPQCGTFASSHEINFSATSHGQQADKTYTGTSYDLISGPHGTDTTTSSQTGEGTITYTENKVKITC
jgi:hypothetical protein